METKNTQLMLAEIEDTQKMCHALLKSPHYQKIGPVGIYAIVEKAKSVGISPMDALNGSMYFVQGKVEMTAALMNQLIRQHKHSITKDKKSDANICILHGRRSDTGDTWVESFSIDDAKLAGIYRNQWLKYPKDMLFARALSRLARQLFPDVIKGCYVQGEIEIINGDQDEIKQENTNSNRFSEKTACITEAQYEKMMETISPYPELVSELKRICKVADLRQLNDAQFKASSQYAKKYIDQKTDADGKVNEVSSSDTELHANKPGSQD